MTVPYTVDSLRTTALVKDSLLEAIKTTNAGAVAASLYVPSVN